MTAIEFYAAHVKDGRALLTTNPPRSYSAFLNCSRPGRPVSKQVPIQWLSRIGRRLILCVDREPYPVARFVRDDAEMAQTNQGDWRVGRNL